MRTMFENHDLTTERCGEFVDVTDDVVDIVGRSGIKDGIAVVYSPHTTCAIVINEQERGFQADFCAMLDRLAPEGIYYLHDDQDKRTENLEDPHEIPNGHGHVRGGVIGSSSETIPVRDGALELGTWQRVFLVELDRSRERKVYLQVMGE